MLIVQEQDLLEGMKEENAISYNKQAWVGIRYPLSHC
jgi:hypothetical protein